MVRYLLDFIAYTVQPENTKCYMRFAKGWGAVVARVQTLLVCCAVNVWVGRAHNKCGVTVFPMLLCRCSTCSRDASNLVSHKPMSHHVQSAFDTKTSAVDPVVLRRREARCIRCGWGMYTFLYKFPVRLSRLLFSIFTWLYAFVIPASLGHTVKYLL